MATDGPADRRAEDDVRLDPAAVDHVLRTTRAVRRRLDLDRSVPNDILWACIDVAEQAPSGGGLASRRWLVLRDPEVKRQVAERYRAAGGDGLRAAVGRAQAAGREPDPVVRSGAFLAQHLEEVPALVLLTIWGTHDSSGNPGLFDSVVQAGWSFCVALRARGLGTTWTTLFLAERDAVAELLGIPPGVTQVALFPVAYTLGTTFHPVRRDPATAITYVDRWGFAAERPPTGEAITVADGARVVAERDVAAPVERVTAVAFPLAAAFDAAGVLGVAPHAVDVAVSTARVAGRTRLRLDARLRVAASTAVDAATVLARRSALAAALERLLDDVEAAVRR